jgi:hypothetical protein
MTELTILPTPYAASRIAAFLAVHPLSAAAWTDIS